MPMIPTHNKLALSAACAALNDWLKAGGPLLSELFAAVDAAGREAFTRGHGSNFANTLTRERVAGLVRSAMVAQGFQPVLDRTAMRGADHRDVVADFHEAVEALLLGV